MTVSTSHSPRRYVADANGHRVLVGLTREETFEFEGLDRQQVAKSPDGRDGEDIQSVAGRRRLELYAKHDEAWVRWIAAARSDQSGNSTFFN